MQEDFLGDLLRPIQQRYLPVHEITQQSAQHGFVAMPCQPSVGEIVHGAMVIGSLAYALSIKER